MVRFFALLFGIAAFSSVLSGAEITGVGEIGSVRDTSALSVHFRFDNARIDTSYMENGVILDSVLALLSRPYSVNDTITITAAASPDGKSGYNLMLSRRRAESIRDYLVSSVPGLTSDRIRINAVGEDWAGLKKLVLDDPGFPSRDAVLGIIDSDRRNDTKEKLLRAIPGVFGYLVRNHLYYLRSATLSIPERPPFDSVPGTVTLPPRVEIPAGWGRVAYPVQTEPEIRKLVAAFRTNLLVPAMNAGIEVPIGNSWSVAADYYFPWIWPPKKNRWCVEMLALNLEGRYWFGRDRTWNDRLTGHSVGLYAGAGYYDFEADWKGRQGEFINVGLDYLYALPVGKRKNIRLEFSLGLGYIHSWVRPYEVKEEFGALVRDPQELRVNWFGPTKLSVSLVVPIHMKVRAGGER